MSTFAHILAATDLTGRSVYALQRALQIKAESNCQLTVLHVVEHGLTPGLKQRHYEAALANLEDWKQSLPVAQQLGLDVRVLFGDPFATILAILESEQIELAVVGSPGKNEMKGLFIGTTAERVIRFSPTPVLMVRQHAAGAYSKALVAVDFSPSAKRPSPAVPRLDHRALSLCTHGRGRLAAALLGSVAHAFLATGPCDVLVVRE